MLHFLSALLGLFFLSLSLSITSAQDSLTQTFTSEDGSITVSYPSGWTVEQAPTANAPSGSGITLHSPPNEVGEFDIGIFSVVKQLSDQDREMNLEEIIASLTISSDTTYSDVHHTFVANGREFIYFTDRLQYHAILIFTLATPNGSGYCVTGADVPMGHLEELQPTILEIASSVVCSGITGNTNPQPEKTPQTIANAQLVGIWKNQDSSGVFTYIAFYPDGSVVPVISKGDIRGTYTVQDNSNIQMDLAASGGDISSASYLFNFTLSNNQLVLKGDALRATTAIYTKIREITISDLSICSDTVNTHLLIGFGGILSFNPGTTVNLRSAAGSQAIIVNTITANRSFNVLSGPICSEGAAWWLVELNSAGDGGWMAQAGKFADSYKPDIIPSPSSIPDLTDQLDENLQYGLYLVSQCQIPPQSYEEALAFSEFLDPNKPLSSLLPEVPLGTLTTLYDRLQKGEALLSLLKIYDLSLPDSVSINIWELTNDDLYAEFVTEKQGHISREINKISIYDQFNLNSLLASQNCVTNPFRA